MSDSNVPGMPPRNAPQPLLSERVRAAFEEQIDQAIGVHESWMVDLTRATETGISALSIEVVASAEECAIGRWLAEGIPPALRSTVLYARSKMRHAAFHEAAARVLTLAFARDPAARAALKAGGFFADTARELRATLDAWREHARA